MKTIGIVTNGGCAKIWTHQRKPIRGKWPTASGITTSDITSQMIGPYTIATVSAPAGVAIARLSAGHEYTAATNSADQVSATRKWSAMPTTTGFEPLSSTVGPMIVDATPCHRCA